METGQRIFRRLQGIRESQRQYRLGFMPPARNRRPFEVTCEHGETTVDARVEDFGEHGLLLWSLRAASPDRRDGEAGPAAFDETIDRLVGGLECPYGPVECIEKDTGLERAVLRTAPTDDGTFFEIFVDGPHDVELAHYSVDGANDERCATPVNLGRRAFEKLADTFVEACAGETVTLR